jgi:hypothetical protein
MKQTLGICSHASTAAITTARAPPASPKTLQQFRNIRKWVEDNGGYVCSELRLVDAAPCKCRGVIAASRLTIEELQECPLIIVPESLYLTTEEADAALFPPKLLTSSVKLPAHARLASLLALEKRKGDQSKWHPYIESLPAAPPNAWFYESTTLLDERLDALSSSLVPSICREEWRKSIVAANLSMERLSSQCIQTLGKGCELSEPDLMWALGHVLSRAFGSGQTLGLAPLIDLLNHKDHASKPFPMQVDGQTFACVTSSVSIGSSNNKMFIELVEGEELCISYLKRGPEDQLETYLNFGFVSEV